MTVRVDIDSVASSRAAKSANPRCHTEQARNFQSSQTTGRTRSSSWRFGCRQAPPPTVFRAVPVVVQFCPYFSHSSHIVPDTSCSIYSTFCFAHRYSMADFFPCLYKLMGERAHIVSTTLGHLWQITGQSGRVQILGCNSAVQYSAVQYSAVQYSTVQCSTVQYSTVQCSTVQCSTVQYSHSWSIHS